MIRPLPLACAAALLIAAPVHAQKFVSVDGSTSRTTLGATVEDARPDETAAAEAAPSAPPEAGDGTDAVAAEEAPTEPEAELPQYVNLEPDVIPSDDPIENFIPDSGECNAGSYWNSEEASCVSF